MAIDKSLFIEKFEEKFWNTIERFKLVKRNERIGVALSGGKDSSTVLYLLSQRFKDRMIAISIDEGTGEYRRATINNAQRLTRMLGVEHKIYSFKEIYGYTLPGIIELFKKNNDNTKPCTICGILRRALLNDAAIELGLDVLAVGHSLEDEAQSILMSIFKGNPEFLQRLGPRSDKVKGFVPRIKPLYLHSEKEVLTYALLQDLVDKSLTTSCPFSSLAYRNTARNALNLLERNDKEVKKKIVESFLLLKSHIERQPREINRCKRCGSPTSGEYCSRCKILMKIEKFVNK